MKTIFTLPKIKWLTFFFFLLCFSIISKANHLVGTHFYVDQIDSTRHAVYMTVVRDCNGIQLSNMGIRYQSGTDTIFHTMQSYNLISVKDITGLDTVNCGVKSRCTGSFQYGFEEYVYLDTIDLSNYTSCEWIASFSQCCRHSSIIMQGGDNYYNYVAFNKCFYNSTPKFNATPRLLLLHNQDTKIAFGARDIGDNDSLSYELAPALKDPNQSITYTGNFSYLRPINFLGFPNIQATKPSGFHLNPVTGLLEFRPAQVNQVATIVMQVKEWRRVNGVMQVISVSAMDMFFIVLASTTQAHSSGINNTPSLRTQNEDYFLCTSDTFNLLVTSHDSDFDSTYLSWDQGIQGANFTTTNGQEKNARGTFSWKPNSSDAGPKPHVVSFMVRDNICPLPATSVKTIRLFVFDSLLAASIDLGPNIIDSVGLDTIRPVPIISQLFNRPVLWTTSGDGHFVSPSNINSVYLPGPQDDTASSYQLKLEVANVFYCYNNGTNWSDSILVLKQYKDLDIVGLEGVLYGDSQNLSIQPAPRATQKFWWTSNGDGHFTDSLSLTPSYLPGSVDWAGCGWKIKLHYQKETGVFSYDSILGFRKQALKGDQVPSAVLRGDSIYISAVMDSASNSNVYWKSYRDGTFGDSMALNTYYIPGPQDLQSCGYGMFLREWPTRTCNERIDTIYIPILQAQFSAGSNLQLQYGDTAQLNAVPLASQIYQYGYWTTAGDGSFIDSNDAETHYVPGSNDWVNCGTTLYWNEIDQACGGRRDSIQILRVTSAVDAGADQVQYYSNSIAFNLLGYSDTSNGFQAYWTTSGDGSFNDSFDLNAIYTPGTLDIDSCSPISLRLTGYPIGTCTVFDEMTVLVDDSSSVRIVGVQIDSMTFDTINLSISPVDTRGIITWSSDGTGTFVNQSQSGTDYVLSAQDHQRFAIDLMVSRQTPCNTTSDKLSIDPQSILQGIKPIFEGLVLYPNPASNVIRLEWEGSQATVSVQIMDVLGKTLMRENLLSTDDFVQFDISQLKAGTYMVSVKDEEGNSRVFRFVKNK